MISHLAGLSIKDIVPQCLFIFFLLITYSYSRTRLSNTKLLLLPNDQFAKNSFWRQKIKVAQNVLKPILGLEVLKSNKILKIQIYLLVSTNQHTNGHHSDQISRSALSRRRD